MGLRIAFCNLFLNRTTGLDNLIDHLHQHTTDLVMVSGFRTGLDGMVLRAKFDRMRLLYQTSCESEPDQDTLIVASRFPIQPRPLPHTLEAFRHLWVHVLVGRYRLLGIDSAATALQKAFNTYLQSNLEKWQSDSSLLFCGYPSAVEDTQVLTHAPVMAAQLKTAGFVEVKHESRGKNDVDPPHADLRADLTPCQAWIAPTLKASLSDSDLGCIESDAATTTPAILTLRFD